MELYVLGPLFDMIEVDLPGAAQSAHLCCREMIEALQSEYNEAMSSLSQQLMKAQEAAAIRYAELEAQYKAAQGSSVKEKGEYMLQIHNVCYC
jgi:hypothetical protein